MGLLLAQAPGHASQPEAAPQHDARHPALSGGRAGLCGGVGMSCGVVGCVLERGRWCVGVYQHVGLCDNMVGCGRLCVRVRVVWVSKCQSL